MSELPQQELQALGKGLTCDAHRMWSLQWSGQVAMELVLLVPLAPEPIPGELEEGPGKGTSLDLPDCGARSHVLGEAFDDLLSPGHR